MKPDNAPAHAALPRCLTQYESQALGPGAVIGVGHDAPYALPQSLDVCTAYMTQNVALFLVDYAVFLWVCMLLSCYLRPALIIVYLILGSSLQWWHTEAARLLHYNACVAAAESRFRRRSSSAGLATAPVLRTSPTPAGAYDHSVSQAFQHSSAPSAPARLPPQPLSSSAARALASVTAGVAPGPRAVAAAHTAVLLLLFAWAGGRPLLTLLCVWAVSVCAHAATRRPSAALLSKLSAHGHARAHDRAGPYHAQLWLLLVAGALRYDVIAPDAFADFYDASARNSTGNGANGGSGGRGGGNGSDYGSVAGAVGTVPESERYGAAYGADVKSKGLPPPYPDPAAYVPAAGNGSGGSNGNGSERSSGLGLALSVPGRLTGAAAGAGSSTGGDDEDDEDEEGGRGSTGDFRTGAGASRRGSGFALGFGGGGGRGSGSDGFGMATHAVYLPPPPSHSATAPPLSPALFSADLEAGPSPTQAVTDGLTFRHGAALPAPLAHGGAGAAGSATHAHTQPHTQLHAAFAGGSVNHLGISAGKTPAGPPPPPRSTAAGAAGAAAGAAGHPFGASPALLAQPPQPRAAPPAAHAFFSSPAVPAPVLGAVAALSAAAPVAATTMHPPFGGSAAPSTAAHAAGMTQPFGGVAPPFGAYSPPATAYVRR